MLRLKEVARLLGVHPLTIYRHVNFGRIKTVRLKNTQEYVGKKELERFRLTYGHRLFDPTL